jgi:hypothetical protein
MTVVNIKNYSPERFELLRQVVETAVEFHRQSMSAVIVG